MDILSYLLNKRRYFGTEEATFGTLFPKTGQLMYDLKGNFMFAYVDVVNLDGAIGTTVFSCHLDTVEHEYDYHKTEYDYSLMGAANKVTKEPLYLGDNKPQGLAISDDGIITVKGGGILGADDGAGVWLLVNMIDAEVPGRYFFFAGEESGGIGSKFAVKNHPDLFKGFKRAIAFDRKGVTDIITEQYVGVCASPQFGVALADALSCDKYPMQPAHGVYTDTAEMIGIIPECVNVSVGYYNEHTESESLDLNYLQALLRKAIALDWEALPTVREPKAPKPKASKWTSKSKVDWSVDYDLDWDYNDKDANIDKIVDEMFLAGITIRDLLEYVQKTGDTDLL